MNKVVGAVVVAVAVAGILGVVAVNNNQPKKDTETKSSQSGDNGTVQSAPETNAPVELNTPEPASEPEPDVQAETTDCDPNYDPCVPNVSYDLDCPDIGFSVVVTGYDRHNFDRDGDGYGCESY